jgi:hypothetical protein
MALLSIYSYDRDCLFCGADHKKTIIVRPKKSDKDGSNFSLLGPILV